MGLSAGAVVIEQPMESTRVDISQEAAIAKHHAKCQSGSFLYVHRPCAQEAYAPLEELAEG